MNTNLTDHRAYVCGSTRGIGLACAHALANEGADITMIARDEKALEEVLHTLPQSGKQVHHFIAADFSQPEYVQQQVKQYLMKEKRASILINNTGGPSPGALLEASPEQFLKAMQMHVVCNQLLVQTLLPAMEAQAFGRIINIISTSVREPIPGLGVSNTTRGAVASWAKTLSREVGAFGITVNNVLPGFTETERLGALVQKNAEKAGIKIAEQEERMKQQVPLRRFARPEEIAAAVTFLASPAASYITGVSLPVDGGRIHSI